MTTESIDSFCSELMSEHDLPSLSWSIGRVGSGLDGRAYGRADRSAATAATVDTPYLLASVTKPIVATAVLTLHQSGRLDLDDPVEDHLGGLRLDAGGPRWPTRPTIREVLGHTAGLGTHWDFYYSDNLRTRPEPSETVARYGTLYRAPGARFEYSNFGYGLLDLVIGQVTGQDPAEYVVDQVFRPIGAASGWLGAAYQGSMTPAQRYPAGLAPVYPDYDTTHRGASLAWLSAADLARFGLAHVGGPTVLDAATLELAHQPLAGAVRGDGTSYALGWGAWDTDGHRVLVHGGSMGGVGTVLGIVPELGLSVAVVINRTAAAESARRVLDFLLADLVPWYRPVEADPTPIDGPAGLSTGRWSGAVQTFDGSVPVSVTVADDGAVSAELAGAAAEITPQPRLATDAFPLRFAVAATLPSADTVACPRTDLLLAVDGELARGAARACGPDEVSGRMGDCRSFRVELVRS